MMMNNSDNLSIDATQSCATPLLVFVYIQTSLYKKIDKGSFNKVSYQLNLIIMDPSKQ